MLEKRDFRRKLHISSHFVGLFFVFFFFFSLITRQSLKIFLFSFLSYLSFWQIITMSAQGSFLRLWPMCSSMVLYCVWKLEVTQHSRIILTFCLTLALKKSAHSSFYPLLSPVLIFVTVRFQFTKLCSSYEMPVSGGKNSKRRKQCRE